MIMRLKVGQAKADRDHVEERRVGQLCAPAPEIVSSMEDELEPPARASSALIERLVGAAVGIGHDIDDELALGAVPNS